MIPPEKPCEPPFAPDLTVIDSHTHLWDTSGYDYFAADLLADIAASGHRVDATVYAECGMHYSGAPAPMDVAGETLHAVRQARLFPDAPTRINAAIMGASDLRLGARLEPVMEAHLAAGDGRFRGIRWRGAWDADAEAAYGSEHGYPDSDVLGDPAIVEGARILARMGLVLSVWIFHPQIEAFAAIARQVPDLPIALNHSGGMLGVGRWRDIPDVARQHWVRALRDAAELPNMHIQIGGFAVSRRGYRPGESLTPSDQIAADWKDDVDFLLETFGPDRAIFDSNFPVDRRLTAYGTYLNAVKKMLADYSQDEQRAVLSGTARRFFKI